MEKAPQLQLLSSVAVRAYTEPDVNWWMANRGKSYTDVEVVWAY